MKEKKEKLKNKKPPTLVGQKRKYHFPFLKKTVEAENYAEALKIINQ